MAKKKESFLDAAVEIGASLLIGYVISRFVKIAISRGDSMLPTIKNNQLIIMDCRAYKRREPKRHDLIAFKSHQKKGHKIFLKRVIGLPGDHILFENGKIYLNHQILSEPYIKESMRLSRKSQWIVESGTLFVMGDNRNQSLDSRSKSLGLVSVENDVVGVVMKVIF